MFNILVLDVLGRISHVFNLCINTNNIDWGAEDPEQFSASLSVLDSCTFSGLIFPEQTDSDWFSGHRVEAEPSCPGLWHAVPGVHTFLDFHSVTAI